MDQAKRFAPMQEQLNQSGGNLINQLLTGGQLPGFLQGIPGGISEDVTNNIVQQSLRDAGGQFNQSGIIDSGVRQSISARTAGDIRTQSAQFNLQNLNQLLATALTGQNSVQQPMLMQNANLGSRLSGLRTTNQSINTLGMNPFLKSFQTGLGDSLGRLPTQAADAGAKAFLACWVASEIFGGWYQPKTVAARYWVNNESPKWFKNFYCKYGERIAIFISDKPIIKMILRPLFELFALKGELLCHKIIG